MTTPSATCSGENRFRETDLYGPIRDYLCAQGYTVRGEVRGCDITATRDAELIVIEMKRGFTTDLLIQATRRQSAADAVYVALPRTETPLNTMRWRGIQNLLRRLELGLILVAVTPGHPKTAHVEIVFHPLPFDRRRNPKTRGAILREIAGRSGDYNPGGSTGRPVLTAYRETALFIAVCLDRLGPRTPRALRALGTGEKTLGILSRNVYGWFERQQRGLYALRGPGRNALATYAEVAAHYAAQLEATQTATPIAAPPEPDAGA